MIEICTNPLRWMALALGTASVVFFTPPVIASGYNHPIEARIKFRSHKACVAKLHETAAIHRSQVKPRTFNPDGGFQKIHLEDRSGGVKVKGRKAAQYEARIWYHNGRLTEDGSQFEISHSWDGTQHECKDKILIMNDASGYTLSTFEPVPLRVRTY